MERIRAATKPACFPRVAPPAIGVPFVYENGRLPVGVTLLSMFFVLTTWIATAQVPPARKQAQTAPPVQEQAAPAPPASQDQPIPLAQVAERAEELDRLLDDISKQLTSTGDLLESYRDVQAQAEKLKERIPEIQ